MTTLSTHDTKRSADVRARLSSLSEVPGAWEAACGRWMASSAGLWPPSAGEADRPTQHLLFQTLVGAWPLDAERAVAYLAKATKEAKVRTSWTEPDAGYDAARDAYVRAVLADDDLVADVAGFVAPLVAPGRVNALAQVLLALTVPGVPDIYQGDELWNLSLVDPDNRRPVDFAARRALLASFDADADGPSGADAEAALARSDEGLPKLRVVRAALRLRRRRPEAFGAGPAGSYEPLAAGGSAASHVVAFGRGGSVAVVVPRLVVTLATGGSGDPGAIPAGPDPVRGAWGDTSVALPAGEWTDVLSGATWSAAPAGGPLPVRDLLSRFPVALLERADA